MEVVYPQLRPAAVHQLTQIDIVPHYLSGGEAIACFNGIDVVPLPGWRTIFQQKLERSAWFPGAYLE